MVRTLCLALTLSIATLASLSVPPSTACAQESSELRREARRLFNRGLMLARADRWADALLAFRRSAELVPRASTSYNIANALYRLDKPVEALAELDRYDAMPTVKNDRTAQKRGADLRRLLKEDVALVSLAVAPAGASVFIDGRLVTELNIDGRVQLNPGLHAVRVTRQGYLSYEGELRAVRGSRIFHRIQLKPATAVASPTSTGLPSSLSFEAAATSRSASSKVDTERKPFVKRPGFWILIGAIAAAGVGAGVAVAVVRRNDGGPQCGTTGSCATAQGLSLTF